MDKGLLFVVSGFSGAGKGTIMKMLLERFPEEFSLSVSATTRDPRPGETDGKEYFFKSTEEFESMIADGMLFEFARYVDNYYGTPKQFVFDELERGKDVLLEIEVQGAIQVKQQYPEAVLVFVTPPSVEELRRRLENRGTETPEKIRKRIARAAEEVKEAEQYDYILINDDIEAAVDDFRKIVKAEHYRSANQAELINRLKDELGGEK